VTGGVGVAVDEIVGVAVVEAGGVVVGTLVVGVEGVAVSFGVTA
jgi:hypothetical protein